MSEMKRERKRFEVEKMTLGTQELDAYVASEGIDRNKLTMTFVSGGQGGGNIAAEFCRLGYPLISYNTCMEDLDDLQEKISKMDNHGTFKRIDLDGYGGASKDRQIGLKAIKDNLPILNANLFNDKDVEDSDFVWIVVALGGGTGNGSLTAVSKLISDARYRADLKDVASGKKAKRRIFSAGRYNHTIGVIAALPDKTAKSKIQVNVAQALQELEALQANGNIGAVVLLDNQKLIDDYRENYDPARDRNKTWVEDGNNKVARVITELALTTSLRSSSMLDVAEMRTIWSTPGFMTIGKSELGELWMVDKHIEEEKDDLPLGKDALEKRRVFLGEMLKKSFSESIFVEGTNFESAIAGGMVVVTDGVGITSMDAKDLEDALSLEVFNSDTIESPHYGFVTTEHIGVISDKAKEKEEENKLAARIFTMCVTKQAPQYIKDWFKIAVDSKNDHEKAIKSLSEGESLNDFAQLLNSTPSFEQKEVPDMSLGSIFGGLSELDDLNSMMNSVPNELDAYLNGSDIFGTNNNDGAQKGMDILDELMNMSN